MLNKTFDPTTICQELLGSGKLIAFVGSGLSARFGFPTWEGLVDLIAKELDWDPEVFKLSGNYLQLAEYYVASKGSIGQLRSILDKMFSADDGEIMRSKAHEQLVALDFPVIYTTNYEDVIERSFSLHEQRYKKKCKVITNIDDLRDLARDTTQIVKFHGTFADDASLVITETNYFDRLDFESTLDIKLRADMLGKSLLFLGYSFNDLNVRLMLHKLNKLRKSHKPLGALPTAIMTSFGSTPIEREILRQWDVLIVELDPLDRDQSIDKFLENLA